MYLNVALDHISTRKRRRRCMLLQAKVTAAWRASEETCTVPWTGHPIHRALMACVETIGRITILLGSRRLLNDIWQVEPAAGERDAAGAIPTQANASKFNVKL